MLVMGTLVKDGKNLVWAAVSQDSQSLAVVSAMCRTPASCAALPGGRTALAFLGLERSKQIGRQKHIEQHRLDDGV